MRWYVVAMACVAQVAEAAPKGEWQVTPYIWLAGFEGTIGAAGGDSGLGDSVDVDFGHLWDNLQLGGAMLNVSWRRDRWTAFGDWTYANVRSDSPTRVPTLYESVKGQIKGHIVQAFAGYDLLAREDSHLDLFAGARYFNLDVSLDLAGAALPDVSLDGDDQWLDAVAGARWSARLAGRWRAHAQADAGAGGSDLSWEAIGTVGYDFSWGTVLGGWRYLKADYENGSYRLDAALTGPFLGVQFAF